MSAMTKLLYHVSQIPPEGLEVDHPLDAALLRLDGEDAFRLRKGRIHGRLEKGEEGEWRVLRRKRKADEAEKDAEAGAKKQPINFDGEAPRTKKKKGVVRYQLNPLENWGPMRRAKVNGGAARKDGEAKRGSETKKVSESD